MICAQSSAFLASSIPKPQHEPHAMVDGIVLVTTIVGVTLALLDWLLDKRYYHGRVDGSISSETERAIRWFQSVDKIPISGRIDSATLRALQIS
jgi:Putative peptidoglycan binding domain